MTVEELRGFGVKAEARLEQLETLAERLGTGSAEGDGWLISWVQGAEPDPYAVWDSSQIPDPAKRTAGLNISGFSSAELDKAIDLGRSPQVTTGCDQTARAQRRPLRAPRRPAGHFLASRRRPALVAPEVNG